MRKIVTIVIDRDEYELFKAKAELDGFKSPSEVVRALVKLYIEGKVEFRVGKK